MSRVNQHHRMNRAVSPCLALIGSIVAGCSFSTERSAGGPATVQADAVASTDSIAVASADSIGVTSTDLPADSRSEAFPPPALEGEIVAELRRPSLGLRAFGDYLFVVQDPLVAVRVSASGETVVEMPFAGELGPGGGRFSNMMADGQFVVHVRTAANEESLLLPDFDRRQFTTIPLPAGYRFTTARATERVYLGTFDRGGVAEVVVASGTVESPVTVPSTTTLRDVQFVNGSVWAVATDQGRVLRLDPESLVVLDDIVVGPSAATLEIHGTDLWVGHAGAIVSRVDLASRHVVAQIDFLENIAGVSAIGDPVVALVGDRVFVRLALRQGTQNYGVVAEVDPTTNRRLGWATATTRVRSLLAHERQLLLLDDEQRVVRVDLGTFARSGRAPFTPTPAWRFQPNEQEAEVLAVFTAAYDFHGDPAAAAAHTEDPSGLAPLIAAGFEAAREAGIAQLSPSSAIVDGENAWVSFDILDREGRQVLTGGVSHLQRRDGRWTFLRTQVCFDLGSVGVPCAP